VVSCLCNADSRTTTATPSDHPEGRGTAAGSGRAAAEFDAAWIIPLWTSCFRVPPPDRLGGQLRRRRWPTGLTRRRVLPERLFFDPGGCIPDEAGVDGWDRKSGRPFPHRARSATLPVLHPSQRRLSPHVQSPRRSPTQYGRTSEAYRRGRFDGCPSPSARDGSQVIVAQALPAGRQLRSSASPSPFNPGRQC
jgi:hypothetical protein